MIFPDFSLTSLSGKQINNAPFHGLQLTMKRIIFEIYFINMSANSMKRPTSVFKLHERISTCFPCPELCTMFFHYLQNPFAFNNWLQKQLFNGSERFYYCLFNNSLLLFSAQLFPAGIK